MGGGVHYKSCLWHNGQNPALTYFLPHWCTALSFGIPVWKSSCDLVFENLSFYLLHFYSPPLSTRLFRLSYFILPHKFLSTLIKQFLYLVLNLSAIIRGSLDFTVTLSDLPLKMQPCFSILYFLNPICMKHVLAILVIGN